MAREKLKFPVSLPLRAALGLDDEQDPDALFDYYALLGGARGAIDPDKIDAGLVERIRALRKWQNSPQYGGEVIELLPLLHRAARILQDPRRREAYRKKLEHAESGSGNESLDRFEERARVALAAGFSMTPGERRDLVDFGERHGLSRAQMEAVLGRIQDEYSQARRDAPPSPPQDEWEFKLAGEGEESFELQLAGIKNSRTYMDMTLDRLVEMGLSFGLDIRRVHELIAKARAEWFHNLADTIAGTGVLSDDQIEMLQSRAPQFGLDEKQALLILEDYSLSIDASVDAFMKSGVGDSFAADEIHDIVNTEIAAVRHHSWWSGLTRRIPEGMGMLILGVALLGAVGFGGYVLLANWSSRRGSTPGSESAPPAATPAAPVATPETGGAPAPTFSPSPTPTPTATPLPLPELAPDPVSGMLLLTPGAESKLPPFEIAIHEVTCSEYARYLQATLDPPPPAWNGSRRPPLGWDMLPVTGVTWEEAHIYLRWLAGDRGWAAESLDLPSLAEYRVALAGRTIRSHGDPTAPDYWNVARLWSKTGLEPVMDEPWDRIHHGRQGQVYDLCGNAAEWGADQRGDDRMLLGGSYAVRDRGFNLIASSWLPAGDRKETVGFRYVRHLQSGESE
jgi:hypothetical protein